MVENNNTNPATEADQTISSTTGADTLTGGFGNDTINGQSGDDILHGDTGVPGSWHYETYDYDFGSTAGQAFDIENGTRTASGYVSDFDEGGLTNTIRGTTGNPEDFGVIYTSTLDVTTGGTYRLTTASDDGSTIQIFDSSGNPVSFDNQTGGTLDYLNNDFHQGTTSRYGDVILDSGETYTIQIRYWENRGGDTLSATITGPDTTGTENLLTTDMIGLPPGPDYSVTGVPAGVEGNDVLDGGAGNDTIMGDGGNDTLSGGADQDSIDGGTGDDSIDAGTGNDTVDGGTGNDSIVAGTGNDSILGGDGNDTIFGQDGADTIDGGAGDDSLSGGSGNDAVDGSDGNDTLVGDVGNDTLTGGADDDVFIYNAGDGLDVITDFNAGNSGALNDGNQSNNDFLNLDPFYDSIFDVRDDLADDGVLNQSTGLTGSSIALGGTITLTGVSGTDLTFDNVNVACFTAGTLIETDAGPVAVEHLTPDMRLLTLDGGPQPVRAVLSRAVSGRGEFAPIVITKGALGNHRELVVSPAHRMLLTGWRTELMFGMDEVLASAKALCNGDTIYRRPVKEVEYFHILMDQHEIIFAEGCPTESYHLDSDADHEDGVISELKVLFPELLECASTLARPVLRGYEVQALHALAA